MAFGNPTDAQIAAVTAAPAAKQGDVRVNRDQDGYIFASGILDPEHSNYLSLLFPQYYGTAVLEQIGSYEVSEQDVFSWSEMDRTRSSSEITAGGGVAGATATLTTDIDATAPSDGYFIIGDTLMSESNIVLKVTNVGVAGGFQTIDVVRSDGQPLTATDVVNNERVGHLSNAHGEYSDAPKGRLYLPDERYNVIQTIRRSSYISGKALTNRTYLEGGSWAYHQEMIDLEEFQKDRENAVMFGQLSAVDTDDQTCEGIITSVQNGGVNGTFVGAVTENDVQNQIAALMISSPSDEYIVYVGTQYMTDISKSLRDYHVGGGVDYGVFANADTVGISVQSYVFMGKTIHFMHYPTFDDTETLPFNGTPTPTKINYSNYSLWLSVGKTAGQNNCDLMYKELDGMQRKFILKKEDGLMGDGAKVANGRDGNASHMLSDIGPRLRNLNHHGSHRAIG